MTGLRDVRIRRLARAESGVLCGVVWESEKVGSEVREVPQNDEMKKGTMGRSRIEWMRTSICRAGPLNAAVLRKKQDGEDDPVRNQWLKLHLKILKFSDILPQRPIKVLTFVLILGSSSSGSTTFFMPSDFAFSRST